MIWIDYIIIAVIGISALLSLFRGFVKEAFSLITWVAAFWLSWAFFRDLSGVLMDWISLPSARLGTAFVLIMIVVLVLGGLLNYLLCLLINRTGLSSTDRFLGMFFGAARGAVFIAIIVLLAGLTPLPQDDWWHESGLLGYFEEMSVWLKGYLPQDIASSFSYS